MLLFSFKNADKAPLTPYLFVRNTCGTPSNVHNTSRSRSLMNEIKEAHFYVFKLY
jgi:hypothetical protein